MVYTVTGNIRLITTPPVDKAFAISDDVSCVVSDAICSLNVEFACQNQQALEDLEFKSTAKLLQDWLLELHFVKKLAENEVFNGCQPVVHVDEDSLKESLDIVKEERQNEKRTSTKPDIPAKPDIDTSNLLSPPPLVPRLIKEKAEESPDSPGPAKLKQNLSYKRAIRRKTTGVVSLPRSPLSTNSTPSSSRENSPAVRRKTQPIKYNTDRSPANSTISHDFVYENVTTSKMRERTMKATSLGAIGIGARKLWCEMPQVIEEGYTLSLADKEKKIQEALFEIITTEHTYKKGLDILVTHFFAAIQLLHEGVISKADQKILLSNVQQIREISTDMCKQMAILWKKSCLLEPCDMVDTLTEFANNHADAYKAVTRNSVYQDRKLNSLREDPSFITELSKLEKSPRCKGLSFHSYLTLPMQRITRLPLLLDAVTKRVDPETADSDYQALISCQNQLQNVVKECNEGARQMTNLEDMTDLDKVLQFKKVKRIPIVSQDRRFVKKGNVENMLPGSRSATMTLSRLLKEKSDTLHLILFNDIILVTKRKGEHLDVRDHSPATHITVRCIDEKNAGIWLPQGTSAADKEAMFVLVLLKSGKDTEYVVKCESIGERERWVTAISPEMAGVDDDVDSIYSEWDCPQVHVVTQYQPKQTDELSLEVTEVLKVLRKTAEGWWYGEKISDGEKGWFHKSFTEQIENEYTRVQNMKRNYHLDIAKREQESDRQKSEKPNGQSTTWYKS